MTPIETFERECQELVNRYTEKVNQDVKSFRRILNIIIVANVIIAVGSAIALLTLEIMGK